MYLPCTRTGTQASQLIFGGIGKGAHLAIKPAETVNLTAGIIAAGSAAQSTDMTGTYSFRAPRRSNSNGDLGASSLVRRPEDGIPPAREAAEPVRRAAVRRGRRDLLERRALYPLHDREPVHPVSADSDSTCI